MVGSALRYMRLNRDTAESIGDPALLHNAVGRVTVLEPQQNAAVYDSADTGREGLYIVDLP